MAMVVACHSHLEQLGARVSGVDPSHLREELLHQSYWRHHPAAAQVLYGEDVGGATLRVKRMHLSST